MHKNFYNCLYRDVNKAKRHVKNQDAEKTLEQLTFYSHFPILDDSVFQHDKVLDDLSKAMDGNDFENAMAILDQAQEKLKVMFNDKLYFPIILEDVKQAENHIKNGEIQESIRLLKESLFSRLDYIHNPMEVITKLEESEADNNQELAIETIEKSKLFIESKVDEVTNYESLLKDLRRARILVKKGDIDEALILLNYDSSFLSPTNKAFDSKSKMVEIFELLILKKDQSKCLEILTQCCKHVNIELKGDMGIPLRKF